MFWCQSFGDVSPYVYSYHFISVWVVEWPRCEKELLTRLTICSLCILTIFNFSYFPSGYEGWICVLIAPVPGHCMLVN